MRNVLVACLVALCALPAHAATVKVEFAGTVDQLVGLGGKGLFGPPGTVSVNDTFTGRFTYLTGPSNPDIVPGDPDLGRYLLASFEVDGWGLAFTGGTVTVRPYSGPCLAPCTLPPDRMRVGVQVATNPYQTSISLLLSAPAGTLPDDSLPMSVAPFTGGGLAGLDLSGIAPYPSLGDFGSLSSFSSTTIPAPIPLPATLPLVLSALVLGLGWRRRAYSAASSGTGAP